MGARPNPMTKQFLLSRIKAVTSGCWEWQGLATINGYGQVSIGHRRYRPHRVAMHLWKDFDLESPMFICHHCDNKLCCNPDHLFVGTHSENMLDSIRKGRHVDNRGSRHGMAKLDEDDVLFIRELFSAGWTQPTIAELFPVGYGRVKDICQGRCWKHIKESYATT